MFNEITTQRELNVCGQVVRIERIYETERNIQLLLEFCTGGNLGRLIREHQSVSEFAAKAIAAQLLLTVHLMERFDIVHRDLKPENILIQEHMD